MNIEMRGRNYVGSLRTLQRAAGGASAVRFLFAVSFPSRIPEFLVRCSGCPRYHGQRTNGFSVRRSFFRQSGWYRGKIVFCRPGAETMLRDFLYFVKRRISLYVDTFSYRKWRISYGFEGADSISARQSIEPRQNARIWNAPLRFRRAVCFCLEKQSGFAWLDCCNDFCVDGFSAESTRSAFEMPQGVRHRHGRCK